MLDLVTKRDMEDAEKLAERIAESLAADEFFMTIDWRHDIAQAIADGRRPSEAKKEYIDRVIRQGGFTSVPQPEKDAEV